MRSHIWRLLGVVAAGVALAAASAPGAAGAAGAPSRTGSAAGAVPPGTRLWVSRSPGVKYQSGPFVAASHDGRRVFVAGTSDSGYATVAYGAATGARLWASPSYPGEVAGLAVSPGGRRVFVTGTVIGARSKDDYATVTYDAVTGTRLWLRRYNDPGSRFDYVAAIAVSPRGTTVFVTGLSTNGRPHFTTVAYRAATGAQRWVRTYHAGKPTAITVSPDGATVYVTGTSGWADNGDYATVAYDAATGARRWVSLYNSPAGGYAAPAAVAVSTDGATVYVTGDSAGTSTGYDYVTIAYDAATGARLWIRRYNGPGNSYDTGNSVAVRPGGRVVYVTGASGRDYATIAYDAVTGARLWTRRYSGPGNTADRATSIAVSPGGHEIFVTGTSGNHDATIAYQG